MESNIKKLSMREIIGKVGFPITINEFRNTYKFNVDLQLAMEFEEQLKQIKRMSEIEKIICRYENIFDKEIYVFHLARLLEKDIESLKRAELLGQRNVEQLIFTNDITGKNKRRFFVNAKNLLKKCDVIDIVMKKKSKGEFEIYSSIDFIEENTDFSDEMKEKAIEKFCIIEQKIGFENILKYIENRDLADICRYSNLAMLLMVENDTLENKIRKYVQYIDLDKMLVLANAIYFYKYGENFYKFSKEEAYRLNDFTEKVSQIVNGKIKFLQTSRFYFTIDFAEIKEKIQKLLEHEEELNINEDSEKLIVESELLTKEIISDEDIFKTEIINSEENNFEKDSNQEEKVIGDIFELAKLEEVIEETDIETEMIEEIENQETSMQEAKLEEVEAQEIEVEEAEVEEAEIEETEVQEAEVQETEVQEAEVQEIEIQIIEQENVEIAEENIEDIANNVIEEKNEEVNSTNKFINNFANDETRIIMNFENRKHTIFKLDESYSEENLEDGTTIFSLPNKECYIIETFSNKENLGGNATYIINKDLFEKQRNSLIENNSLKQKKLSALKLNNHKDVTKLVYTGWENAINTFFNMKTEEKYTQEERDNISRIIEKMNG